MHFPFYMVSLNFSCVLQLENLFVRQLDEFSVEEFKGFAAILVLVLDGVVHERHQFLDVGELLLQLISSGHRGNCVLLFREEFVDVLLRLRLSDEESDSVRERQRIGISHLDVSAGDSRLAPAHVVRLFRSIAADDLSLRITGLDRATFGLLKDLTRFLRFADGGSFLGIDGLDGGHWN